MSVAAISNNPKIHNTQILGLVAGEGSLPAILAQSAASRGFSIVALALSQKAADLVRPYCAKVFEIYPGQASKNLKIAHNEGIRDAVMIGRIPKLNILQNVARLDWLAIRELSKLTSFSDDAVQQAIGRLLESQGISIRSQSEFLQHLFPEVGVLTKRTPTADEYADIEYGLMQAKEIARLDIGQTVIVRNRVILAVEGAEGTDKAIRRAIEISKGKPVVAVKVAKAGHDPRFDTPAIGTGTMLALKCSEPGGVLALGAGETMVVDREEVIAFADENDMSVVVI